MTCTFVVELVQSMITNNKTVDDIGNFCINICENQKLFPDDVCVGMVNLSKEPVVYVLKHTKFDAKQICYDFVGYCDAPLPPWNISVPANKPPIAPRVPNKGPKTLKVLHFSDTHYDPLYSPGSLVNCKHPRCCRSTYPEPPPPNASYAGYWGNTAGGPGCDPPLWTMEAAFAAAAQHKPDILYFTGDIPPHDVWAQSEAGNVRRIRNTTDIFRQHFPYIPIVYAMGNHESAPVNSFAVPAVYGDGFSMDYLYGPLQDIWTAAGVPDSQREAIGRGGFYQWSPFSGMRVVAINSIFGIGEDWWMLIDDVDPTGQLAWLVDVLTDAENVGDKVHLLHHHDSGKMLHSFSRNYNNILTRFENTVVGIFVGHTHWDELKLMFDPSNGTRAVGAEYLCPSLSSNGEKSPSFRLYEVDGGYPNATWEVIDSFTYSLNLTLANAGAPPVFPLLYSARPTYDLADLSPQSWADAVWNMTGDDALLFEYFRQRYSFSLQPKEWAGCDASCRAYTLCDIYSGNTADPRPCQRVEQEYYRHHNKTL